MRAHLVDWGMQAPPASRSASTRRIPSGVREPTGVTPGFAAETRPRLSRPLRAGEASRRARDAVDGSGRPTCCSRSAPDRAAAAGTCAPCRSSGGRRARDGPRERRRLRARRRPGDLRSLRARGDGLRHAASCAAPPVWPSSSTTPLASVSIRRAEDYAEAIAALFADDPRRSAERPAPTRRSVRLGARAAGLLTHYRACCAVPPPCADESGDAGDALPAMSADPPARAMPSASSCTTSRRRRARAASAARSARRRRRAGDAARRAALPPRGAVAGVRALARRAPRGGDEIALHGWTHLDEGRPHGRVDRLRRELYTRGEGEFWALARRGGAAASLRHRLVRGQRLAAAGFVAPAWLLGPGGGRPWRAPFAYTSTLRQSTCRRRRRS